MIDSLALHDTLQDVHVVILHPIRSFPSVVSDLMPVQSEPLGGISIVAEQSL